MRLSNSATSRGGAGASSPGRGAVGRSNSSAPCSSLKVTTAGLSCSSTAFSPVSPDQACTSRTVAGPNAPRYLGAFGPATVRDVQAWSGLTGLKAVLEQLRPAVVTFSDEQGAELFDLPTAPRPGEDAPAPPRLVAEFDNLILSHAERSRVIGPGATKRIYTANGII